MIYLLDQALSLESHSKMILEIIGNHTNIHTKLIEMPKNPTYGQIYKILYDLMPLVLPKDIVLCPWAVDANINVDEIFNELAGYCWVVVAAGNFNQDINKFSPARAQNVITVACLNKSGIKAALSNYSEGKELVWIPGTNYDTGPKKTSGTSISAAIYAAFLAETIESKKPELLEELMEKYKEKVFQELQPTAQEQSLQN